MGGPFAYDNGDWDYFWSISQQRPCFLIHVRFEVEVLLEESNIYVSWD